MRKCITHKHDVQHASKQENQEQIMKLVSILDKAADQLQVSAPENSCPKIFYIFISPLLLKLFVRN